VIVAVDVDQFAAPAFAEAERHPARSADRRAACHAWSALITSPTAAAAKRAIGTFGDPATQAAAIDLLHRLAATASTAPKGTP
jgi:hypothetical protein